MLRDAALDAPKDRLHLHHRAERDERHDHVADGDALQDAADADRVQVEAHADASDVGALRAVAVGQAATTNHHSQDEELDRAAEDLPRHLAAGGAAVEPPPDRDRYREADHPEEEGHNDVGQVQAVPPRVVQAGPRRVEVVDEDHERDRDAAEHVERVEAPLHDASAGGYYDIARVLLQRGAKVDAIDNDGDSPLHLASNVGHAHVVDLLLNHAGEALAATMRGVRNANGELPADLAEDPSLVARLRIGGECGGSDDNEAAGAAYKRRA